MVPQQHGDLIVEKSPEADFTDLVSGLLLRKLS